MWFRLSVLLLLQLVLHSYTVALPCHPLLVKDNEECACPNGANDHNQRRDVYGGLVHCSFQCKNGTGCYAAAEILYPACVTFDHKSSRMIAGYCPAAHWKVYSILSLPDYINNSSCPTNRAGTLCGNCIANFSIDANSIEMDCHSNFKCHNLSWLASLFSFLPLTLMSVVVAIFQPQLVSPKYNTVILAAQLIALPSNLWQIEHHKDSGLERIQANIFNVLYYMYDIWNLDSTHNLLSDWHLCFSSMQAAATVHYLPAIYTLSLVMFIYISITLHANNCKLVVCVWRPFAYCFSRLRRRANPQASVVYAFAVFFLLAYSNIVHVSMYLLLPTSVYDINGTFLRLVMLYDGNVDYFSQDHSPLCYIALALMIIAMLPPVLLLVYQLGIVHRCLETCHLRSRGLVTLLEAFQGHFRDGTNGGKDFRFLAVLYFTNRLVLILLAMLSKMYYSAYLASIAVTVCMVTLVLGLRPYKTTAHNIIEGLVYLYISAMTALQMSDMFVLTTDKVSDSYLACTYIFSFAPAVYFAVVIIKNLVCCVKPFCTNCCRPGGSLMTSF